MKFALRPDTGACRLCHKTSGQREFWRERFIGTGQTLRLCSHCGGVYLGPDFTEDALNSFYAADYRKFFYEEIPSKAANTFFRLRGDDTYAALRFSLIEPFLPDNARMFEMGSGSSAFLGHAASIRPDLKLWGCEPDKDFRQARLGTAVVHFLDWGEYPKTQGGTDLVAAFHVLEHLQDVSGFLSQTMDCLRSGGHLAIEVPDVTSNWSHRHFVHPAHLTYFSPTTLRRVLEAAGFEVVTCGPHPAGGVLKEYIWAIARKPEGNVIKSPITDAQQEEIENLDRKISSISWTWRNSLKQALKHSMERIVPIAWLTMAKRRKHYAARMRQPITNFRLFESALRSVYGEETARIRHEAYFLAQHASGPLQSLRATLALVRDMARCSLLPHRPPVLKPLIGAVSLERFRNVLETVIALDATGTSATVIARPDQRRAVPGAISPSGPGLVSWRSALSALLESPSSSTASLDGLTPWTLRCCIARHRLWGGAWKRTLTNAPEGATLLLHNDFDMFSRAGVEVARQLGLRSICVQHGLPTDEYFPTSADVQLVWGRGSAQAYTQRGTLPSNIVIGTPLAAENRAPLIDKPPFRILLVSQSHTPIYGVDLVTIMATFATDLARRTKPGTFEILLHPEELGGQHPYQHHVLGNLCHPPPHTVLKKMDDPALVVGFCSTALIEAARSGHYVVGLDAPVATSGGAAMVGRPQHRVKNAAETLALFESLQTQSHLRKSWRTDHQRWLSETFEPLPYNWIEKATIK